MTLHEVSFARVGGSRMTALQGIATLNSLVFITSWLANIVSIQNILLSSSFITWYFRNAHFCRLKNKPVLRHVNIALRQQMTDQLISQ